MDAAKVRATTRRARTRFLPATARYSVDRRETGDRRVDHRESGASLFPWR